MRLKWIFNYRFAHWWWLPHPAFVQSICIRWPQKLTLQICKMSCWRWLETQCWSKCDQILNALKRVSIPPSIWSCCSSARIWTSTKPKLQTSFIVSVYSLHLPLPDMLYRLGSLMCIKAANTCKVQQTVSYMNAMLKGKYLFPGGSIHVPTFNKFTPVRFF